MKPSRTDDFVHRAAVLSAVAIGIGLLGKLFLNSGAAFATGLVAGVYLLFAIKVADQWEKVAVLRLGRYVGLHGPGMFHIVDRLSRYVDQRVRVASVTRARKLVCVSQSVVTNWRR